MLRSAHARPTVPTRGRQEPIHGIRCPPIGGRKQIRPLGRSINRKAMYVRSYTWLRTNQNVDFPIDSSASYENTSMLNVAVHRPLSPGLSGCFTTHLCFSSRPTLLSALVAVVAGAAFCRPPLRTMSSRPALSENALKKHRRARALLNRSLDAERDALHADVLPVVHFRCRFISHVVRASLSAAGPGCVVVLGVARECMLEDMLTAAELTAFHDPASHYVFNSTPLGVLKRLLRRRDNRADTARRFGALQEGSAGAAEIRCTANRMAKVLTTAWRTGYVAKEPNVLVSAPGAARQLPHADNRSADVGDDRPDLVGFFGSVQEDMWVILYPRVRHKDCVPTGPVVEPLRVHIPRGGCVLFRGDLVHRGEANPLGVYHRRNHASLHLTGIETHMLSGQGYHVTVPTAQ